MVLFNLWHTFIAYYAHALEMSDTNDSTTDESSEQTVTQNVNVSIELEDTSPSIIVRGIYFLLSAGGQAAFG